MASRRRKVLKKLKEKATEKIDIMEPIGISPEIEPMWRDPLIKVNDCKVVTIDEMVKATKAAHGIPAFAARFLGLSRSRYLKVVRGNRRLAQIAKNEKENIIDIAEGRLYEALAEGSKWAVLYVLDTLGKERGWTTEMVKEAREGELLKNIGTITGMDTEELEAYDEEQEGYDYDKRNKYQLLGTTVK